MEFTLQAAYTTPDGERVRPSGTWRTSPTTETPEEAGEYVVEDVKSKPTRTRVYLMKKENDGRPPGSGHHGNLKARENAE